MQQPNNTPNQSKKERAQLNHCLKDVDFYYKPKTIELFQLYGHAGFTFLDGIIALCSRATDAVITLTTVEGFASMFRIKNWSEILEHCLNNGLLQKQGDLITNSRGIEDQEKLAKTRKDALERQQKYKNKDNNNALATRCPDTDTVTDTERSKKEMVYPASLNTKAHHEAVQKWVNYLKKYNKFMGEAEIEALLLNWSNRSNELILAVNQSIERGYRKLIYEPPNVISPKNPLINQQKTVSASESMHPAVIAERRRKVQLNSGGSAKC